MKSKRKYMLIFVTLSSFTVILVVFNSKYITQPTARKMARSINPLSPMEQIKKNLLLLEERMKKNESKWKKEDPLVYERWLDNNRSITLSDLESILKQELQKKSQHKYNILVWDPPFGNFDNKKPMQSKLCGVCNITLNKTMVLDPDTKIVVFHFAELPKTKLPSTRRLDQYYVWWTMESQATLNQFHVDLDIWKNFFNLTMTHKKNSDILTPYGAPAKILTQVQKTNTTIDQLMAKKKQLALWVVSNCQITGGAALRMDFFSKLAVAGLKVDLGGKCFPNGIKEWNNDEYKFYLSFENSYHCTDYITEKLFFNAFKYGVVPVVFGARKEDYLIACPPNSFIYAEDFSVEGLVDYLHYLNRNDREYRKYLKWRELDVKTFPDYHRGLGFCQQCRILHGINFDNIFTPNFQTDFLNDPLFGKVNRTRNVGSLRDYFYGEEKEECMRPAGTPHP